MVDRNWHVTYTEIKYTNYKAGTRTAYLCADCPHAHSSKALHQQHFRAEHPPRKPPWSYELAALDLTPGVHYALTGDGIYTPEELAARPPNDIYYIRGIGETRFNQIQDALCRYHGHEPRQEGQE